MFIKILHPVLSLRFFASTCILVFVAGCGTPYKNALEDFTTAETCCSSFQDIDFESFQKSESFEILLDKNSPAFNFLSGKSYFRAFELPDSDDPYDLLIESYSITPSEGPHSDYIFVPSLTTLDADFSPIRKIDDLNWYDRQEITAGERKKVPYQFLAIVGNIKLVGRLAFNRGMENERYLIVHTTDALRKLDTRIRLSQSSSPGMQIHAARNAPMGAMKLSFTR